MPLLTHEYICVALAPLWRGVSSTCLVSCLTRSGIVSRCGSLHTIFPSDSRVEHVLALIGGETGSPVGNFIFRFIFRPLPAPAIRVITQDVQCPLRPRGCGRDRSSLAYTRGGAASAGLGIHGIPYGALPAAGPVLWRPCSVTGAGNTQCQTAVSNSESERAPAPRVQVSRRDTGSRAGSNWTPGQG